MDNVIERIAHFADIDTRRAMGFGPRKLPPCHFDFPEIEDLAGYIRVKFNQDVRLTRHYHSEFQFDSYAWVFGRSMHPSEHRVYAMNRIGSIGVSTGYDCQESWHPDMNRDGSFKRVRPKLNYGQRHRKNCILC